MSIREVFPGDRGGDATQDVAALLDGMTLPSIEPFTSDNAELVGLPDQLLYTLSNPAPNLLPEVDPPSVLSVAQAVRDAGMKILGAVKRREDAMAAFKAQVVDRVAGAAAVERSVLKLDGFQRGVATAELGTDVAFALGIPEPTAATLIGHSVSLVGERPAVVAALAAGELSWRHAVVIDEEITTLSSMAGATVADEAVLEGRLLFLAPGTTSYSFMCKARRVREKMFPETIPVRVKEAFAKRKLTCDVGADGMAWLGLQMPAVSASGIYTRCTRLARAMKAEGLRAQREADAAGTGQDVREHRTLSQLRVDIAATLLLGQNLPATAVQLVQDAEATLNTTTTAGPGSSHGNEAGSNSGSHSRSGSGSGAGVDCGGSGGPGLQTGVGALTVAELSAAERAAELYFGPDSDDPVVPPAPDDPPDLTGGVGVVGDGSGWVGGVVDGIVEDSQAEYLEQLAQLARRGGLVDPPLPEALVLVKVPFLGLLGITDEPAELVGPQGGPVPEEVARKLLSNGSSFLRVLTDPITGEALPLEPQRYTLRAAERAVLQGLAGCCYVPNCPHPVMDTELDHLRAFEFGGLSTAANVRPACRRHHRMKHFKDDKNRRGRRRSIDEPERAWIKLRGWTPKLTTDGRIGWITPSGEYRPPLNSEPERPEYPKWLKKLISKTTKRQRD